MGNIRTTPEVTEQSAQSHYSDKNPQCISDRSGNHIKDRNRRHKGKTIASADTMEKLMKASAGNIEQQLTVSDPVLWSVENPYLYRVLTTVIVDGKKQDNDETTLGIRSIVFDTAKGLLLNGKHVKINGVCNHHDLGFLGAAVNHRALERQLEILKTMGVNGIRTSHNPPAPELLDLCDRMGFMVMDEAFDMWKKGKTQFDYSLDWDKWHQRDIQDMVLRDRNHPSVFLWSIGNEVVEQWDTTDHSGTVIAKELVSFIKNLDRTRPVTANCNSSDTLNPVLRADTLDIIGYSYHQDEYAQFRQIASRQTAHRIRDGFFIEFEGQLRYAFRQHTTLADPLGYSSEECEHRSELLFVRQLQRTMGIDARRDLETDEKI